MNKDAMPHRVPFRIVQPYGRNIARDVTAISNHETLLEAVTELKALRARMRATGVSADAITLLILDANGSVVSTNLEY